MDNKETAFNPPPGSVRAILILIPLIVLGVLAIKLRTPLLIGGLLSLVSTGYGYYFGTKSKPSDTTPKS